MQRSSTCRRRPDGNSECRQHDGASDAQPAILGEEVRDLPRPHPYQQSRAQRCADRHFPRSLATVRGEVMRSSMPATTWSRAAVELPAANRAHEGFPLAGGEP
jgi:hypothetical protein